MTAQAENQQDWTEPRVVAACRKYAWDYFSVHASQRLTTFQFYVTLSTAMTAGYMLLMRNTGGFKWMAVIGVLLFIFSITFWQLDRRNRELVKNGERALKHLDSLLALPDAIDGVSPLRLFNRDENGTSVGRKRRRSLTYSYCFNIVFVSFGLVGILSIVHALYLPPSPHQAAAEATTSPTKPPNNTIHSANSHPTIAIQVFLSTPSLTSKENTDEGRGSSRSIEDLRDKE